MKSLSDIASILKSKDCIYILTHQYPDGDTLGSAYALCRALQCMNKKVKVLCHDEIPKKYKFMEGYIVNQDFIPEFIMSVDVADTSQFGRLLEEYSNKVELCIDHHMTNRNYADITFVNSVSSSTAEIIYDIIQKLGVSIDKEIAECIYVGISTDTGCFKYSNVTALTHKVAHELIEKGINLGKINKELFDKKSKRFLNLESMMYKSMEYFFQDQCAVMIVTQEMLKKSGVPENELEGIASIPRSINGVRVGITIREKRQKICKVSVRTSDNVSAVSICEKFGGGGHSCASGCTLKGDVAEVKSKLLECVREIIKL